MKNIDKVVLQVLLKDGDASKYFTFSRTWTPLRTVLRFETGPLDLFNATFYVLDAELAGEYLLLGLPVLMYLGIDTKTPREKNGEVLDCYDCYDATNDSASSDSGNIGQYMNARPKSEKQRLCRQWR